MLFKLPDEKSAVVIATASSRGPQEDYRCIQSSMAGWRNEAGEVMGIYPRSKMIQLV